MAAGLNPLWPPLLGLLYIFVVGAADAANGAGVALASLLGVGTLVAALGRRVLVTAAVAALALTAAVALGMANRNAGNADHVVSVLCVALTSGLAIGIAGLFNRLTRMQRLVRELAVAHDRERIAADVHDSTIQRLYATGLRLEAMRSSVSDAALTAGIDRAVDDLDETIRDLRRLILSPEFLEGNPGSLEKEIEYIVDEASATHRLDVTWSHEGRLERIPATARAELLKVVREGLSNVGRHAEATTAIVTLRVEADLCLTIRDNGRGYAGPRSGGRGIENLRRRAEALGGKCRVYRGQSGGTVLEWRAAIADSPPGAN